MSFFKWQIDHHWFFKIFMKFRNICLILNFKIFMKFRNTCLKWYLPLSYLTYSLSISIIYTLSLHYLPRFIFKFILLTGRKATEALYIGHAITPICFRKCLNIAVRLKFYILFLIFHKRYD